jgi:hypothetical protein
MIRQDEKGRSSPSPSPVKRSVSCPNRLRNLIAQGAIDEESPHYISAMKKMYEAAWKFDRTNDEIIVKVLMLLSMAVFADY